MTLGHISTIHRGENRDHEEKTSNMQQIYGYTLVRAIPSRTVRQKRSEQSYYYVYLMRENDAIHSPKTASTHLIRYVRLCS